MEQKKAQQTADEVIALYKMYGDEDYIGEPVSQLEHMCQCAQLAEKEGDDNEVILAAFFHDIGHLCEHILPAEQMDGYGVMDHEKLGSQFLRKKGFSEKITKLVMSHVQAKRYLTYRYPEYYEKLSEASRKTLSFQGGVMTNEEAAGFESDALFNQYISLRKWDEEAKEKDKALPLLDIYRERMVAHLISQNNNNL